jgi:hypothetical protein
MAIVSVRRLHRRADSPRTDSVFLRTRPTPRGAAPSRLGLLIQKGYFRERYSTRAVRNICAASLWLYPSTDRRCISESKTILTEFAPLISASQNFAASFKLTFHLHPYTDEILDHLEEIAYENQKFRFEYLAVRMRDLGPAVRHIEERVKESGASRMWR